MDTEEVALATKKLHAIDPRSRPARLMSGHINTGAGVASGDVITSAAGLAEAAAVAALRAQAVGLRPHGAVVEMDRDDEVCCPYNRYHRMGQSSLKHHLDKCPDRPGAV